MFVSLQKRARLHTLRYQQLPVLHLLICELLVYKCTTNLSLKFGLHLISLGFESPSVSVDEPGTGRSAPLEIPVIRTGGTLGVVAVNWHAELNGEFVNVLLHITCLC